MKDKILVAGIVGLLSTSACGRLGLSRNTSDETVVQSTRLPVTLEPATLGPRQPGAVPYRILLDEKALARLQESARSRTPAFVYAQRRADEALAKPFASGYQGFEWADALASSALLWHATADAR